MTRHYDWLGYHARTRPEAPCWTDLHSSRSFTYGEAEDRCLRLAAHLARNCGVTKGDRVAILAMNSTDYMEVHSACAKIGAIFLPLNWRLAPPEVDFILGDADPKVLIHDLATQELVDGLIEAGLEMKAVIMAIGSPVTAVQRRRTPEENRARDALAVPDREENPERLTHGRADSREEIPRQIGQLSARHECHAVQAVDTVHQCLVDLGSANGAKNDAVFRDAPPLASHLLSPR